MAGSARRLVPALIVLAGLLGVAALAPAAGSLARAKARHLFLYLFYRPDSPAQLASFS